MLQEFRRHIFHDEPARLAIILVCTRTLLFRAFSIIAFHPATRVKSEISRQCLKQKSNQCSGVLLVRLLPKLERSVWDV